MEEVKEVKSDSAIKVVGYSILGLIVLLSAKAILFPTGYGVSVRYNMPQNYRTGFEHGYNVNYGLNSLSGLIFQILLVVLVLTLIVGVFMLVKRYLFSSEEITEMKESFSRKSTSAKIKCSECGKDLNSDWKVCPYCGEDSIHQDKL